MEHLLSTTKQYICKAWKCQKAFSKPSLLLRHSLVHYKAATSFQCNLCSKMFSQNTSLQKHLKKFVCDKERVKVLDKTPLSLSKDLINTKSDQVTLNGEATISGKNMCIYCDKNFLKPSDLKRHIRIHTNERNFKCTKADCSKAFKLKNTLNRHLVTHEKSTFTCKVCSSNYKSHKVLQNHMKLHSCRWSFQEPNNLNLPSPQTDILVEQANEVITGNKSTPLSDLLCEANESTPPHHSSLKSPEAEINHVEIGNEEIVDATDEIDERVEVSTPFSKKVLICETCQKCFKKPIDLRRHFDAVHEKKRPFKCSVSQCDKSFSLKCTLNRHVETHKRTENL